MLYRFIIICVIFNFSSALARLPRQDEINDASTYNTSTYNSGLSDPGSASNVSNNGQQHPPATSSNLAPESSSRPRANPRNEGSSSGSQNSSRPPQRPNGSGGESENNGSGGNTVVDAGCVNQYTELITQCAYQAASVDGDCDENQNDQTRSAGSSLSNMAGQISSAGANSIAASCNKMVQAVSTANLAVSALKKSCSSSISSCTNICSQAQQFAQQNGACLQAQGVNVSEAQEHISACSSYNAKVNDMGRAISNALATGLNAQKCNEMAASGVDEFCKKYPTNIACTNVNPNDCSNPAAANSKVCICASNPRSPDCIGAQSMASVDLGSGSFDSSSRLDSAPEEGGYDELSSNFDVGMQERTASAYGSPVDGKQGGSGVGGGGGGSGGAGGAGGGGGAAAGLSTAVNGGYYGGGGGPGGMGGNVGGGAGGGYKPATAGGVKAAGNGVPDLRQFLPGGSRHVASKGMGGLTGPDGITGPHTNIWTKIQNRYRYLSNTLMP